MALDIGARLGPYEITGHLGTGGMGQVFRARDTRLNRTVAIKVSNEAFTARFEHEARAVAALNHPNICQLYDVGPNYLVLEHVAGAPVMPTDSTRKLLDIAVQIADGMAAAHEAGFVHRDLKPSNVLVTPQGRVKILDFGLVKNVALEGDGAAALTVTAQGLVAGTTAYMSPEQARGEPTLDARSDQFSFGLLLYELATGKRPFDRATGIETLAAIIRDDPEPLPPKVLAPLRWIVARCLAKEPRDRYASSRDLYLELKNVQANVSDASGLERQLALGATLPRRRRWRDAAAFAAGAAVIAALGLSLSVREPPESPNLRFTPFSAVRSERAPGPVWSPDGRSVAYAAPQPGGFFQVWVRDLESHVDRPVTSGPAGGVPAQWTTAGRILFMTFPDRKLWSVLPIGGEPQELLQLSSTLFAISRDGSAIAYPERDEATGSTGIRVRSPITAEPRWYEPAPFTTTSAVNSASLSFSPDGKQLLLAWTAPETEAWLMPYPADPGNPPRRILEPLPQSPATTTPQFSWLPDNRHIVLSASRDSTRTAQLFLADTVSGKVSTLSHDLSSKISPVVSPDGSRVIFTEDIVDYDIVTMSLETGAVAPLVATARVDAMPAWAANENALVYFTDRSGQRELWLHEEGEGERPVVTADDFPDATTWYVAPALAPDARRVIYGRQGPTGVWGLYMSAVAGGEPVLLVGGDAVPQPGSWSPDGNSYVYFQRAGASSFTLNTVRTSATAAPVTLKAGISGFPNAAPAWSPRNDWILYQEGGLNLKLIAPDGSADRDLHRAGWACAFAPRGDRLYCISIVDDQPHLLDLDLYGNIERDIGVVPRENRPAAVIGPQRVTVTPDGTGITYNTLRVEQNLYLLEGLETFPLP